MCLAILNLHQSSCSLQGVVERSDGAEFDFYASLSYDTDMKNRENVEYVDDVECDGLNRDEIAELLDLLNTEVMRSMDMSHD